jgi:F-type H+-transporting ATPase subunit epsilon
MHVLIARVNETLFDGDAYSLRAPGEAGELTVLAEHMPLVTPLKEGIVYLRSIKDEKEQEFSVKTGVLEVHKEGVTVLL